MPELLLPFVVVAVVLTITPGPDMMLVLRNGITGGSRAAWWTGLGCCTGIAVWAVSAVVGLSVILQASTTAYDVVRIAGAVYLVYLGVRAIAGSFSRHEPDVQPLVPAAGLVGTRRAFRQGLISNLLNPKIALLFVTLVPQFIARGEPVMFTTSVLAGCFLGIAVVWWRLFSLLVMVLGRTLSRPRVQKNLNRATGAVLIAFGARIVFENP